MTNLDTFYNAVYDCMCLSIVYQKIMDFGGFECFLRPVYFGSRAKLQPLLSLLQE